MPPEQIKWMIETFLGVEVSEGATEVALQGEYEGITMILPPPGEDWCELHRKGTGGYSHWKSIEAAVRSLNRQSRIQTLPHCRIHVTAELDEDWSPIVWISVNRVVKIAGTNVTQRVDWESHRRDEIGRHMAAEYIDGDMPGGIFLDWLIDNSEDIGGELEALLTYEAP